MTDTTDKVIASIPVAIQALASILNLIASLRAASGLTDEQLQDLIDQQIPENDRKLLALLAR